MSGCKGCIYRASYKEMKQSGVGCDYYTLTGKTRMSQLAREELKQKPCKLYERRNDIENKT